MEVLFDILHEVEYHMSSCLRLGVDTQYNVFKIIVHGCSIIYKVVYLL